MSYEWPIVNKPLIIWNFLRSAVPHQLQLDPTFFRCRSPGGMILVWHLHSSCAQLLSETVLAEADGALVEYGRIPIARRFFCVWFMMVWLVRVWKFCLPFGCLLSSIHKPTQAFWWGGALALSCGGHWIAMDSGSSIQERFIFYCQMESVGTLGWVPWIGTTMYLHKGDIG